MRYKIDPEILAEIGREVAKQNLPTEEMFQAIRDRLAEEYPDIISSDPRCWIGSRAGGVLGKMTLLYASMNEYLIIFGCPAGTQGFSGRYNFVEIWDFFVAGETLTCDLESDQCEPTILRAGDRGYLAKGQSLTCEMKAGAWMIEYGRGPNITALPFALMDSLLSSLELGSFWLTIKEYSHFIIKDLKNR